MTKQIIVHGLPEVLEKLGPELIDEPFREFFKSIGQAVKERGQANAPFDRGELRGAVEYEVDTSTPPLWAKVGLTGAGGLLQVKGKALEGGTKRGHFPPPDKLRGGYQAAAAISRRGIKPRRWLWKAGQRSLGDIKGFLKALGNDILAKWDRG